MQPTEQNKPRQRITPAVATSLLLLLGVSCLRSEASVTTVSNLGTPSLNAFDLLNASPVATSFTTGPAPSVLSSVTVQTSNISPTLPDTFAVAIWSDNAGHPGTPLESYPSQYANSATALLTYTSPAGLSLAPNTTYWTVLTLSGTDGGSWYTTNSPAQTSNYDWAIGDFVLIQSHATGDWFALGNTPEPGLFSIDATVLPEPSTPALTTLPALAFLIRPRRKQEISR